MKGRDPDLLLFHAPLLRQGIVRELETLIADASAHPERFEVERYSGEWVRRT